MTEEHLIIIVSALGGIIGGMGLGGGTLLIPLLTLCSGLEQHLAQSINLIAFVPMSIVALVIHKNNGYVDFKKCVPIATLALFGAVAGSFLTAYASGYALKASFGAFLTALGVYQMAKGIVAAVKNKKSKTERAAQNRRDGATDTKF